MRNSGVLFGELALVETEPALSERDPNPVPDYEVIQHIDVKHFSGTDDLMRDQNVFRARCWIARWMIMAYNQGSTVATDGLFEDFTHTNHRGIERANVDRRDRLNPIFGVEQHGAQMFLIQVAHLQQQQIGDIGRTLDLPARQSIAARDARPQFDRGFELGGPAGADASDELLQLGRAECEQAA